LREDNRQRERYRVGRQQCAGQMNERAERAIIISAVGGIFACGNGRCAARCYNACRRMPAHAVEMHMPESEHELDSERKERKGRTQSQTRSEPMHRRYVSHALTAGSRTIRFADFSYNITSRQSAGLAINPNCCKNSSVSWSCL